MEGKESVLDTIYEEDGIIGDETLDDEDVEMIDAETLDRATGSPPAPEAAQPPGGGDGGGGMPAGKAGTRSKNNRLKARRKKNKKKKKGNGGGGGGGDAAPTITNINRFVIDTCRRLREKKSYLVWSAVGCLGVSVVGDLVDEVEVIQGCGGQKTADGKRFRSGGGILWNILKAREPKAFKEIMAKGRDFEKQFRQPKRIGVQSNKEEEAISNNGGASDGVSEPELGESAEHAPNTVQGLAPSNSSTGRSSVLDRIRVPVAYDDLFEEGEIQE